MLNTNHQIFCNKNSFKSLSVCLLRGANLVTALYVLEVIINMKKEIEGVKKDAEYIRGNMEDIERGIYKKIDESVTWMTKHFTRVIKSTLANLDVPVTGEFCIFGFYFNLNLVINVASSPKKG